MPGFEKEYQSVEHALKYLAFADKIPHRVEGEAALLDEIPAPARRVLDLGTGDGRLMALVLLKCPGATGVAVDFSSTMLEAARARFGTSHGGGGLGVGSGRVRVLDHDLSQPLGDWGRFDVVCSSFAIHHVTHERKRTLYAEIFDRLEPGGVFCNLEHVASPTPELHKRFLGAMGIGPDGEDKSNILLDVETQLRWLREIGFADVDCLWKWRELALLVGLRASERKAL